MCPFSGLCTGLSCKNSGPQSMKKMLSAGKKLLNAGEKVLTRVEKVSGACSPVWRITYLQALCHHPDRSGGNFIGIPDLNVGSSSPQVFLYCLFLLAKVK